MLMRDAGTTEEPSSTFMDTDARLPSTLAWWARAIVATTARRRLFLT